ncbi:MAG: hypothetical protein M0P31_06325 [Solirubrobacteraceae bacterium]|nr:hypothetical protein [Solirubrobacteraceae bacterium]
MTTSDRTPAWPVAVPPRVLAAVGLVAIALALLPALRAETRLRDAQDALPVDPAAALDRAAAAEDGVTFERGRLVRVEALARLGRPREAERLALRTLRHVPDDALLLRWVYATRLEQGRRRAARLTLDRIGTRDPMWALGLGR